MGKKEKSQTCSTTGWCKNHLFQLNPLKGNLYFRKAQKIRLCPKLKKNTKIFQKIFPQVNRDKKFYTPSFILEEQGEFYNENDEQMKVSHTERIRDLAEGQTKTIMVPNHARKRKYCSVCGDEYQDYLEHINLLSHKENIKRNKFTGFIREFQDKYKKIKSFEIPIKNPIDETEDLQLIKSKDFKNVVNSTETINKIDIPVLSPKVLF